MNRNPWAGLPAEPPFVLPEDAAVVHAFNAEASEGHRLRVDELLPEPFVGDPEAPVLILGNNPGYTEAGARLKRAPGFAARLRANLAHPPSDYPFLYLSPDAPDPARRWWRKKLRGLLDLGEQRVARSVFAVEHSPYGSVRYGRAPRVPSQEYSFELVRRAMTRGAVIVLTRGRRRWLRSVPGLDGYARLCELSNPMAGTVSRRNCDRFEEVRRAVGGA